MSTSNADTLLNRFFVKAKFRHIQVLIKLAELGSMRRTAEAVNMTQPAISQLVSELERLLEAQLFFRHAKGVEPTEVALDLLPISKRILAALEDGSEAIASRLLQNDGLVRVSASPAAIGGLIQNKIASFADRYPTIQVHVNEIAMGDPTAALTDETVDLVCMRQPPVLPEGWFFEPCLNDQLVAVCGLKHAFAERRIIDVDDLGSARWLLHRVGSVARSCFEDLSREYGWTVESRCQVVMHIPSLTHEMLATGRYVAILPRSVALPWLADGSVVELDTVVTRPLPPLGVLWKRDTAPTATARFAAHLKS